MVRLRIALGILVTAAALHVSSEQVMMVHPPLMMMRHPNHPHHPHHIIERELQPVQASRAAEYSRPEERIDEESLQQRIKELEASKQEFRQKQIELDDKIAILNGEIVRCEKEIAAEQQEIRKLDELERLYYLEQIRLERLMEQQRMADYQEKLNQERLASEKMAQERVIEEMNHTKERQRHHNRKDNILRHSVLEANDEIPTNGTHEFRMGQDTSGKYRRRLDGRPENELRKDTVQTLGSSERARKNEQPHSMVASLLRPKLPVVREALPDLEPKAEHVIEKKAVHEEPVSAIMEAGGREGMELPNEPPKPHALISAINKKIPNEAPPRDS